MSILKEEHTRQVSFHGILAYPDYGLSLLSGNEEILLCLRNLLLLLLSFRTQQKEFLIDIQIKGLFYLHATHICQLVLSTSYTDIFLSSNHHHQSR